MESHSSVLFLKPFTSTRFSAYRAKRNIMSKVTQIKFLCGKFKKGNEPLLCADNVVLEFEMGIQLEKKRFYIA